MTGQVVREKRFKVGLPQRALTFNNISTAGMTCGAIGIENLTTSDGVRGHHTHGHAQDQHQSKNSG
jgi:hypothetical protein